METIDHDNLVTATGGNHCAPGYVIAAPAYGYAPAYAYARPVAYAMPYAYARPVAYAPAYAAPAYGGWWGYRR